jgi:hypothetical protein
MTKTLASTGLLLAAILATTGCISTHETIYADTVRTKVTFASDRAGRVFYETLTLAPESRPRTEKHTEVNLILIDVDQRTLAGPNRLFNEAVAFCDTNHDGEITEAEADIFAKAWPLARESR